MEHLLDIRGLKIQTQRGGGRVNLLDSVDLSIKKKQSFGIVGESGCGKSITVNAVMRPLPYPLEVSGGSVTFAGSARDIDLLNASESVMRGVRGGEISMIFQEPMSSLDPVFDIGYQMREAIQFHAPKTTRAEARERSLDMLAKVNIPRPAQTLDSYPHQLSGGQLQRVMIAIALMNDPRLLIADEPTTALDVTIQAQILDLMNALKETRDTSIIMITHDLGVIAETCEQVAVFYAGQAVEIASAAELFHNPAHPYTIGLLKAVTSLGADSRELYVIPGSVPPGGAWPDGCRFRERCRAVLPECSRSMPDLREIAPGHMCRCIRAEREAAL